MDEYDCMITLDDDGAAGEDWREFKVGWVTIAPCQSELTHHEMGSACHGDSISFHLGYHFQLSFGSVKHGFFIFLRPPNCHQLPRYWKMRQDE